MISQGVGNCSERENIIGVMKIIRAENEYKLGNKMAFLTPSI